MQKLSEEEVTELFLRYAETKDLALRNTLLEHYLFIAEIVAKKFIGRGVEYDDLFQVACVALVSAIERFDISRGIKFSSFATPSLIGEIKNYFRDKTRMLHISRRDSEDLAKLKEATMALSQQEDATPLDFAKYMGISEERVLELLELKQAASVVSLEGALGENEEAQIGDFIGEDDLRFEQVDHNDFLQKAFQNLSEEERQILYGRFWENESQKQVAQRLHVSQMHISRKEKKILEKLRGLWKED